MSANLTWLELKKKGNSLYGMCHYQEALNQYCNAATNLEKQYAKVEMTNSIKAELAKIYSNKAVTQLKLALQSAGKATSKDILQKALDDGMKCVQLDPGFQKGYYRIGEALCELNRKDEAVKYINKLLDVHYKRNTKFQDDACLVSLMKSCKYYSQTKETSQNWDKVKYKDNCLVVDPHGAGDLLELTAAVINFTNRVSFLVRPGRYRVTSEIVLPPTREVDIVGDIQDNEEVVFYAKGKVFAPETCNVFLVIGGTLTMNQVTVQQSTDHPERHAILGNMDATIELINVKGYSKCSGCVAALHCTISLIQCTFDEACGAVILGSGTKANIKQCTIKNCGKIGIELRDRSSAIIEDCEVINCGSQAIVCHAEATGFTVKRCILHNNARFLGREATVQASCGKIKVSHTQITGNNGGGILVSNKAHADIDNCSIGGGNYGIGFSLSGTAYIKECEIRNVDMGISILFNMKAKITLENNNILKAALEVVLTDDDIKPKMIGTHHRCESKSDEILSEASAASLSGCQNVRHKDKFRPGARFEDPRKRTGHNERSCFPCGMSQSTLGTKFMMCSGCKVSWYCSKKCQKKDWPIHKEECKKLQKVCRSNDDT